MKRRTRRWSFKFLRKSGRSLLYLSFKALPLSLMIGSFAFIFFGIRQMVHADPYFRIERISVFPSGLLNHSERQFLEENTRARSLFDVDLKTLSLTLEKNPVIKRAEVLRILPDQLNIYLTPRLAWIQVQLEPQGPYYLVSDDQLVLSSQKLSRPDLMILEDFSAQRKMYSPGVFYQNKYFHELFPLFESLKNDPLLKMETISRMAIDPLGNITWVLKDGIELRIGQAWALSDASRLILGSVLKSKERDQILYIDLRYRDMIVKKKA